jgi:hypothetical protein
MLGRRASSLAPTQYVTLRVLRHFMPAAAAQYLLRRGWFIRAGAETAYPASVANFYLERLRRFNFDIADKRILLFGYGGRFDLAIGLLESGAAHVVVCDQLAEPDHRHNAQLLSRHPQYLENLDGRVVPHETRITTLHNDIRKVDGLDPVDIVFSNSVFEHLRDVPGITEALARLTLTDGIQIHRIDLRDHYFKYPFEMLRFSARTWARFLDPSSHHNRYRLWDFRQTFERHFSDVDVEILHSDPEEFERIREQVREEFVSGDLSEDTATIILLVARGNKVRPTGRRHHSPERTVF